LGCQLRCDDFGKALFSSFANHAAARSTSKMLKCVCNPAFEADLCVARVHRVARSGDTSEAARSMLSLISDNAIVPFVEKL
jgi:hypothetical protein